MKARSAILALALSLLLPLCPPARGLPQEDTGQAKQKTKQEESGKAGKQEEAAPQDDKQPGKDEKSANKETPAIKVSFKISAEGVSSLPSGARIKWQAVDKTCSTDEGQAPLNADGTAVMNLPVCTVKLIILITGFDAKSVTLDISAAKDKYKTPIGITIKRKGAPEVAKTPAVE